MVGHNYCNTILHYLLAHPYKLLFQLIFADSKTIFNLPLSSFLAGSAFLAGSPSLPVPVAGVAPSAPAVAAPSTP